MKSIRAALRWHENEWKLNVNGKDLEESEWTREKFEQVVAEILYSYRI